MIKEQRAVFLCILTLIVYVGTIFFEKGFFAFPFPLNEVFLFVLSATFFNWNSGESKRLIFSFGIAILFRLLSQVFIWSFFLSEENFDFFESIFVLDFFYGLYLISLIYFSVSLFKEKNKTNLLLRGLLIGFLLISFIIPEVEFFALILMTIMAFFLKRNEAVYFLIILFFILELFKLITFLSN